VPSNRPSVPTFDGRWVISKGEQKYLQQNLTQCLFVNYKSHMGYAGAEPGPSGTKDGG